MKIENTKSSAMKIASSIIAAAVVAVILASVGLLGTPATTSPWAKIFLAAAAGIIVLQVVPGIMLLGAMFKGVCSVVGKKELLIADKDPAYCEELADYFKKAGYRVETADCPEEVMGTVSEMQAPVLLLGSDFSRQVPSSDLIHLFKMCNRNLHIIMVSDQMSLDQTRQVRQEGIFFQALKPSSAADAEELSQVVDCAFKHQASVHGNTPALLVRKRSERSAEKARLVRKPLMKALPWLAAALVVVIVANYAPIARGITTLLQGASPSAWIFIAFCALIVTYQMLPVFRIKLKLRKMFGIKEAKEGGRHGE